MAKDWGNLAKIPGRMSYVGYIGYLQANDTVGVYKDGR